MTSRSLLRNQLQAAWSHTIEAHYQKQRINSERGLQAFFCSSLLDQFDEKGMSHRRRIFVEPRLVVGKHELARKPDVLICNTRSIIGIVELKYIPRGYPRIAKDLETLEQIARNPEGIRVQNNRYLGPRRDGKAYPLGPNPVLCWAGIHRPMSKSVSVGLREDLHPYFLELRAATRPDADPEIS